MSQRFDVVRGCFYLLALVIFVLAMETMFALGVCGWTILMGDERLGACAGMGDTIKDLFFEILTSVLVLLQAQRRNGNGNGHNGNDKPKN